jgi:hypothetical protein
VKEKVEDEGGRKNGKGRGGEGREDEKKEEERWRIRGEGGGSRRERGGGINLFRIDSGTHI